MVGSLKLFMLKHGSAVRPQLAASSGIHCRYGEHVLLLRDDAHHGHNHRCRSFVRADGGCVQTEAEKQSAMAGACLLQLVGIITEQLMGEAPADTPASRMKGRWLQVSSHHHA